jgi:hypothetical protein
MSFSSIRFGPDKVEEEKSYREGLGSTTEIADGKHNDDECIDG